MLDKMESVTNTIRKTSLVQQSCQLVWQVEVKETENVVFVVVGRDQSGMWNLVFKKISEKSVELTEQMTAMIVEVTILAVNKEGVVDKATVEIEHAMCGDNHEHIDESYAEESSVKTEASSLVCTNSLTMCLSGQTLYFTSLIILMVILIILLSIFIIKKKSGKKLPLYDDSMGHLTKDAFLASKDDFEFDENNQQMYNFF